MSGSGYFSLALKTKPKIEELDPSSLYQVDKTTKNNLLSRACSVKKDWNIVKRLIARSITLGDPKATADFIHQASQTTPLLILALQNETLEFAKQLIQSSKAGGDPIATATFIHQINTQESALLWAISVDNYVLANHLLDLSIAGGDRKATADFVHQINQSGNSSLVFAIFRKNLELSQRLIQLSREGGDRFATARFIHQNDDENASCLSNACELDHIELIKLLIDQSTLLEDPKATADFIHQSVTSGTSPLILALAHEDIELAHQIICLSIAGEDPKATATFIHQANNTQESALLWAISVENYVLANHLLDLSIAGGDRKATANFVHQINQSGNSSLVFAIFRKNLELSQRLIQLSHEGRDCFATARFIHKDDDENASCLSNACELDHIELIKLLIDQSALLGDPKATADFIHQSVTSDTSPLILAIANNDIKLAHQIICLSIAGGDPKATATFIHQANTVQDNAFFWAASIKHDALANQLLDLSVAGGDPKATAAFVQQINENLSTGLIYADSVLSRRLIHLSAQGEDRGATAKFIHQVNEKGVSSLSNACELNDIELIKLLIDQSILVTGQKATADFIHQSAAKSGTSPLIVAIENNDMAFANQLLDLSLAGRDPKATAAFVQHAHKNQYHLTSLMSAVVKKDFALCERLIELSHRGKNQKAAAKFIHQVNQNGATSFSLACSLDKIKFAWLVIQASVNFRDLKASGNLILHAFKLLGENLFFKNVKDSEKKLSFLRDLMKITVNGKDDDVVFMDYMVATLNEYVIKNPDLLNSISPPLAPKSEKHESLKKTATAPTEQELRKTEKNRLKQARKLARQKQEQERQLALQKTLEAPKSQVRPIAASAPVLPVYDSVALAMQADKTRLLEEFKELINSTETTHAQIVSFKTPAAKGANFPQKLQRILNDLKREKNTLEISAGDFLKKNIISARDKLIQLEEDLEKLNPKIKAYIQSIPPISQKSKPSSATAASSHARNAVKPKTLPSSKKSPAATPRLQPELTAAFVPTPALALPHHEVISDSDSEIPTHSSPVTAAARFSDSSSARPFFIGLGVEEIGKPIIIQDILSLNLYSNLNSTPLAARNDAQTISDIAAFYLNLSQYFLDHENSSSHKTTDPERHAVAHQVLAIERAQSSALAYFLNPQSSPDDKKENSAACTRYFDSLCLSQSPINLTELPHFLGRRMIFLNYFFECYLNATENREINTYSQIIQGVLGDLAMLLHELHGKITSYHEAKLDPYSDSGPDCLPHTSEKLISILVDFRNAFCHQTPLEIGDKKTDSLTVHRKRTLLLAKEFLNGREELHQFFEHYQSVLPSDEHTHWGSLMTLHQEYKDSKSRITQSPFSTPIHAGAGGGAGEDSGEGSKEEASQLENLLIKLSVAVGDNPRIESYLTALLIQSKKPEQKIALIQTIHQLNDEDNNLLIWAIKNNHSELAEEMMHLFFVWGTQPQMARLIYAFDSESCLTILQLASQKNSDQIAKWLIWHSLEIAPETSNEFISNGLDLRMHGIILNWAREHRTDDLRMPYLESLLAANTPVIIESYAAASSSFVFSPTLLLSTTNTTENTATLE